MKTGLLDNKSLEFAVRTVKLYYYLCSEKKEYVISKQLLRSGTSIGANIRESRNAQSDSDYVNKLQIALKEADETQYWLELSSLTDLINKKEFESINKDVSELIALLTASINTKKKNSAKSIASKLKSGINRADI